MITQTIDLLGRRAKDKVTGFEGVVSSVSFDLYGCIQIVLVPAKGSDGKLGDAHWFDVQRLTVLDDAPVMRRPDFGARSALPENYDHGPAEKPARAF